jgi:tRNA 2-(methylsulfanyl)-N6-isopentenyladenosine37 hydroxylase
MKDLPLISKTPDHWADAVCAEPAALLSDHLHLEKKAALNAMELLHRCPDHADISDWTTALAAISRDEAQHLHLVARLMKRRGWVPTRGHRNAYAADLHRHVRMGQGPREAMDRLMVSALIEARSCERFEVLSRRCPDPELADLYRGLLASEKGHFTSFLDLGGFTAEPAEVASRWTWWLERESAVLSEQALGPRLHSGVPPTG